MSSTASAIAPAKGNRLNRPTTWFAPTKSFASSSSQTSSSSSSSSTATVRTSLAAASPGNPFAVSFGMGKGKHKLSPSPSPHRNSNGLGPADEDFVMISPLKPSPPTANHVIRVDNASSSPFEDSPTPACGVASATARLRLVDTDDSPLRKPAGQSRSLGAPENAVRGRPGPPSPLKLSTTIYEPMLPECHSPAMPDTPLLSDRPPPQPLFPLRQSYSAEVKPSGSKQMMFAPSKAVRIEESRIPRLSQKKAISLDQIPMTGERDEAFGSVAAPSGHARKVSRGNNSIGGRAHKRINSGEGVPPGSMSRSMGHKSGLALTLSPANLPDFASTSSLSSLSTNHLTPPISAFSPSEPTLFEDVKPLQEVFEQSTSIVEHKFKPRDSGVGGIEEEKPIPPPSTLKLPPQLLRPKRPAMLKRTSSAGAERACETPTMGVHPSWPGQAPFTFLGDDGLGIGLAKSDDKRSMPGTPVKKLNFGHAAPTPFGGMSHSRSQPTLSSSDHFSSSPSKPDVMAPPKWTVSPSSNKKPMAMGSPDSPDDRMNGDHSSPSVRAGRMSLGVLGTNGRLPMSRMDSGSESEGTPTKGRGDRTSLGAYRPEVLDTPSKSTHVAPTPLRSTSGASTNPNSIILPRLSLPAFTAPKLHRTLHHRQSHPANSQSVEEEDVFERKFITLDTLGKGAFSVVVKVQDRHGDGLYAVKKARGVFDGVNDRLRHLEEVDILRHLSKNPCTHVLRFVGAWEQNRQLFIQTELCLGTLAFFLEEYGRVVERLDEGRVWKIVRELGDGIHHIHSNGVIHFDIKPANILIDNIGQLKIADFGLATRWPRISPAEILQGSGLGSGNAANGTAPIALHALGPQSKIEREGDRVYMPPEMLRGEFLQAADIFSFGLVILEVSTNICVPDGGPAWHALREDDFGIIDLSPLSPVLVDLIHRCMASDPHRRPIIVDVVNHPVVVRARNGREALAPEEKSWIVDVLGGGFGIGATPISETMNGDVEMLEA